MAETRDERRARTRNDEKTVETPPTERTWIGWVIVPDGAGWRRARIVLPESVVRAHAIEVFAPDVRAIVAARIEQDLMSDRLVDRRGWEPKR